MYVLTLDCPEAEAEILSADLWEHGATGILEESPVPSKCRLRAWFADPDGLLDRFKPFNPTLAVEIPRDWEAEVRQAWQPFCVGQYLYLAPEWDESPAPDGRRRLTVHPGLALGTGAHPATQLALLAVEEHGVDGARVIDVGTGSGILAAAAGLLGASLSVGCDIDADSVGIAHRNLLADCLPPRVFTGSLRSVATGAFDILVANINAETHAMLAADYARVARRAAIVSGYQSRDEERVLRAMTAQGFQPASRHEIEDWVCLVLCKEETS
jgi:ribosomal protein L11 methyltransferase